MKQYYNITVNFFEDIQPQTFALHTDVEYGDCLSLYTDANDQLTWFHDDAINLWLAIYYHLTEVVLGQYRQEISQNPAAPTILDQICTLLSNMGYTAESEDDCSLYWIRAGMTSNNDSFIRKGLFRAFVHDIKMEVSLDPNGSSSCSSQSVLEFDYAESENIFTKLGGYGYYDVGFTICDPDGDVIEEWYECPVNTHEFIGELIIKDAEEHLGLSESDFFVDFVDAITVHAAKMLLKAHDLMRRSGFESSSLTMFLDMALDNGFLDEEECENILANPTCADSVEEIYEVIYYYSLLEFEFHQDRYDDPDEDEYEILEYNIA